MNGKRLFNILLFVFALLFAWACSDGLRQSVIFQDEFNQLPEGNLSGGLGINCAYKYSHNCGQIGEWLITGYGQEQSYRTAWQLRTDAEGSYLAQTMHNVDSTGRLIDASIHPMITAGDSLLHDYTLEFSFKTYYTDDKCGVMFRMQDPRRYYFFGMEGNTLVIKLIDNETAPHRPFEKVLASRNFSWEAGTVYKGVLTLREDKIFALMNDSISMMAYDHTYKKGRFGLLADAPADFYNLEVRILNAERRKYQKRKRENSVEIAKNLENSLQAVLWKKFSSAGYGSESSLRIGDLDNDGEKDFVFVQLKAGSNAPNEPSCITAVSHEGKVLWQWGNPDTSRLDNISEVPLQIHDLNNDGWRELTWYNGREFTIMNGRTGRVIRKLAYMSPVNTGAAYPDPSGNAIFFTDMEGNGFDQNLVLKDALGQLIAFDKNFRLLWKVADGQNSYPLALDYNKDGKNEILSGLKLFNTEGKVQMDFGNRYQGKAPVQSAFIHSSKANYPFVFLLADKGLLFSGMNGHPAVYHPAGYTFGATVADFNRELPGLEMVVVNFWGSQGVVNLLDAKGQVYRTFETVPFGSRCLPVNWKGDGEEYFLLNADPGDGGMYDGSGHLAVVFPDDGHPVHRCSTADLTGDQRDEIILWDRDSVWIYTQADNPRTGRTYAPVRTEPYNQSDYQLNISLPSWSD